VNTQLAHALFAPKSVALIGASGDEKKNTSRPQRYLRKHGYTGRIIPVNPGRAEIFGEKAYPDLQSVPDAIDHAFIMVPANAVGAALEQCVAKQVPVATIYSDGFAETGEAGRRKQEELLKIARAGGVRVLGPNCIGILSIQPSLALSVIAVLEMDSIKPGPFAIVSQSGSMIGGLLSRGIGRGEYTHRAGPSVRAGPASGGGPAGPLPGGPASHRAQWFVRAVPSPATSRRDRGQP